jgi:hypothetical protein
VRSLHLNKIFADYAEDARFHDWNKGRSPELRFVYVCEYETVGDLRQKHGGYSQQKPSATMALSIFRCRERFVGA